MILLSFTKIWGCYQPGDQASFPADQAADIVKRGVASEYIIAAPVAEQTPTAPAAEEAPQAITKKRPGKSTAP